MHCLSPRRIHNPAFETDKTKPKFLDVPCGKCEACKQNYVDSWVIRLTEAANDYKNTNNYFLTLTYNETNLPISLESGDITPRVSDVQLWWHRFQRYYQYRGYKKERGVKYFLVSEHGDLHNRPHYHALVFNCPTKDLTEFLHIVEKTWKLGFCYVGRITPKRIRYVVKYINKDVKQPDDFKTQSKGLGLGYVKRFYDYHKSSPVNHRYYTFNGRIKMSLPRYYQDKLFDVKDKLSILQSNVNRIEANNLLLSQMSPEEYERKFKYDESCVNSWLERYYKRLNDYKKRKDEKSNT